MKWRFRVAAVAGNALEYYDIAVFAAISMYLSAELELQGYTQATEMVWGIFALRFIARPLGGYIIGRYADKTGKKSALILTSFITGSATLCMAFIPIHLLGIYTPLAILLLQIVLSFSYAGEYPSLATYLLHEAAQNELSRISALMMGSGLTGIIVSLGVVFLLENILSQEMMQAIGWRIPLLLGVVNIVISFWFRYRLPNLKASIGCYHPVNWYLSFHIFLIAVPGAVIFYALNLSSSLIRDHLNIGDLKSVYSILISSLLLLLIAIFSWLTDKYSSAIKIYHMGVIGIVIFATPLYFMMGCGIIELIILSQLIIMVISSMILCNWAYMMARDANGQVTTLSMGYNLSSTLVGGITPLIISYLVGLNLVYVGVFLSVCGLTLLLSYKLPKPQIA